MLALLPLPVLFSSTHNVLHVRAYTGTLPWGAHHKKGCKKSRWWQGQGESVFLWNQADSSIAMSPVISSTPSRLGVLIGSAVGGKATVGKERADRVQLRPTVTQHPSAAPEWGGHIPQDAKWGAPSSGSSGAGKTQPYFGASHPIGQGLLLCPVFAMASSQSWMCPWEAVFAVGSWKPGGNQLQLLPRHFPRSPQAAEALLSVEPSALSAGWPIIKDLQFPTYLLLKHL